MSSQRIVPVTDDSFEREVLRSDIPVVVFFHASWCVHCPNLREKILQAADAYAEQVKVVSVDVDDVPKVPALYNVRGMPMTLFLFRGHEIDRILGAVEESVILTAFEKLARSNCE